MADMDLRLTLGELQKRLKALSIKMRNQPERLRVDAQYLVPYRATALVDNDTVVEVTQLFGDEAVAHAVFGLTSIHIEAEKQNPRETLRAPGAIALPRDWFDEFTALNALRAKIEGHVSAITDVYVRQKLWSTLAKSFGEYLSGLQVMRRTWIVDEPQKIKFYWDAAPSIQSKPASEWVEKFEDALKKVYGYVPTPDEITAQDQTNFFAEAVILLRGMPASEMISACRTGQPHIRARVTHMDSKVEAIIRTAPTPIVYLIEKSVPSIKPLSSCTFAEIGTGTGKARKLEDEPFFKPLNLYKHKVPATKASE